MAEAISITLPPEIHRLLRSLALRKGVSEDEQVSQLVVSAAELEGIKAPKPQRTLSEVAESIRSQGLGLTDDEHAELMRNIESRRRPPRKADFG